LADSEPTAEPDIFVPDFCQPRAVAIIIIGAELLAFTLVLANARDWTAGLNQLAVTSLYVQWAALVSGGLLCIARRRLVAMATWLSATIAFLIPIMVNFLVTISAYYLTLNGLLSGSWAAQSNLTIELTQNLIIAVIVSGVVLRYLYTRHEAKKKPGSAASGQTGCPAGPNPPPFPVQ
jgi:two-component system sensor histidine kinase AlgZ